MGKKELLISFFVALVAKVFLFSFFVIEISQDTPENFKGIAHYHGDTPFYIQPVENFYSTGFFSMDNESPYIYRTPFYGSVYFFFRVFLSENNALSALVILQLIFEIISVFLLSLMVYKYSNKKYLYWATLIIMSVSAYVTSYAYIPITDSFSVSLLIFSFYFFDKYVENRNKKPFWISSLIFAYLVLIKPYFGAFYLLFGLFFILEKKQKFIETIKYSAKKTFLFFLPFIFFITPWIVRNYVVFDKIIPFNDYGITEGEYSFRRFIASRGESIVHWDHSSAGCYFWNKDVPCDFTIPEYFLCEGCTVEDIEKARILYISFLNDIENKELEKETIKTFDHLTKIYKEKKPLNYYLISRVKLVGKFVINSGSFYLPYKYSEVGIFKKIFKLLQSLLYFLALIIGVPYLLFLAFKDRRFIFFTIVPIFLIVFFPIYYQATEWRMFTPFYPFAIVGLIFFADKIVALIRKVFY